MKLVAASLLILNILYAGWAMLRDPPAQPPRITGRYDSGSETIALLSEADRSRQSDLNRVISNPIVTRPASRDADVEAAAGFCTALGPFATLFDAESIVQQAAALDITATMKAIDLDGGETDYRVLLPPASSVEEAFRKLRELKSLGIDSYIITQGEQAMGISLGLFSTRDAAEALRAERERQGYEVIIEALPQVERQFWVFDDAGQARGPRLDAWRSLVPGDSPLSLQSRACPD